MKRNLISIITPTSRRQAFLPLLYECVRSQDWPELEWLVEDDSPLPSHFMMTHDAPWVSYRHDASRQTIGEKRNLLIARATGEYIAHFDDDDYYAPGYLSTMMSTLRARDADMCKLSGFFIYHASFRSFAYWDLKVKSGLHFTWAGRTLEAYIPTLKDTARIDKIHYGYGFSYLYKREVWEQHRFPAKNWNEDGRFIIEALTSHSVVMHDDISGLCLHVLHGKNSSKSFAQYLLPPFMLEQLFPTAKEHLTRLTEAVFEGR